MLLKARSRNVFRMDLGILLIGLALLVVGLVMVYSASYGFSLITDGAYEGQPTYFIRRQLIWAAIGLASMFVLSRIDYHLYRKYAVHILVLSVGILLVMAVMGRWLVGGTSVQPSELARVGAIVYIAVWLSARGTQIRDLTLGLVPFALLLGVIAGLIIMQPDFSTAALLVVTATAMYFAAGADTKQLLITFVTAGVTLGLVAFAADYRSERIDLWISSPFSDTLGSGFQVVQSLMALSRGGWLGVGLGQSQQKFAIYAPHTDGIFAIIGEEVGFVGAALVILLYALWTWRGLRVAREAADSYGMLLAVGIVMWVTFGALLHIAVITASTPFTGAVLPFISGGGSSLVSTLASLGILMNISRGARRSWKDDASWKDGEEP
ncbi:MAG: FtsW/RodA/SpoVE family cell cycle protein [Anaerolineae bacterium]